MSAGTPRTRRIAIIGAGPGGLGAAIQLKARGYDDLVILEKAAGVGGTWQHNRYPGAACDVQSHLYSFSFAIKKDWTRPYATQPEILAYFEQLADDFDLRRHLRLETTVVGAHWDEECALWRLVTDAGDEITAEILIGASGMFNELNWPAIDGLDSFGGTIFHSARWDQNHDLTGERVAVIGSAASAVQFVPEIAKQAGALHVFQRTANWVLPKDDTPFTPAQLEHFRTDPLAVRQHRWEIFRRVESVITFSNPEALAATEAIGRRHLEVVEDPAVRAKLTPHVPYGCQRPLVSNEYFPTFNRPNDELVTDHIVKVTADSIVTADGVERPVDTIVVSTGFETTRYFSALDVVGRGGQRLSDSWNDGAQAYLGITTSGFPNLFMLYGPNTNNGSIIFMLECQIAYLVHQIERMDAEQISWLDVHRDVMDRYNEKIQADCNGIAVWQASCSGYYRSPTGRIVTQWPHTMGEYRDWTGRPDPDAFEVHFGRPLALPR
jgi:cation diffusion facilitator CzcD-associated flavoprotein CzcO